LSLEEAFQAVARRHLKKDDRTLQCGLPLTPKFQRTLAADRLQVTCGACELVSRPKIEKPAPVEAVVAASPDWQGEDGEDESSAPESAAM
jgi:hypothetical protein